MSIIAWLVIGAVAGWAAQTILKTKTGMVMMIGFGIVGALVGGAVGSFFGKEDLISGINLTSLIVAIVGAVALGAAGGWWARRSAT